MGAAIPTIGAGCLAGADIMDNPLIDRVSF
jgi:hypothetical protein